MFLLAFLPGCGSADGADGRVPKPSVVVNVSPGVLVLDSTGVVSHEPCYVSEVDGTYDYAACCPEGWYFIGVGVEGGILCGT